MRKKNLIKKVLVTFASCMALVVSSVGVVMANPIATGGNSIHGEPTYQVAEKQEKTEGMVTHIDYYLGSESDEMKNKRVTSKNKIGVKTPQKKIGVDRTKRNIIIKRKMEMSAG